MSGPLISVLISPHVTIYIQCMCETKREIDRYSNPSTRFVKRWLKQRYSWPLHLDVPVTTETQTTQMTKSM